MYVYDHLSLVKESYEEDDDGECQQKPSRLQTLWPVHLQSWADTQSAHFLWGTRQPYTTQGFHPAVTGITPTFVGKIDCKPLSLLGASGPLVWVCSPLHSVLVYMHKENEECTVISQFLVSTVHCTLQSLPWIKCWNVRVACEFNDV